MIVGWVQDEPRYVGGAELTMSEFRAAAPADTTIVDCPADGIELGLDAYVIGNCVSYGPDDLRALTMCEGQVVKYVHDMWPHGDRVVREWLIENATLVFCSPLHLERFPHALVWGDPAVIPPALDLEAMKPPRQSRKRRKGCVSIGAWRNPGKGQQLLLEWSEARDEIDIYGEGEFVPHGPKLNQKGPVAPEKVAQTLWGYETFVYLPTEVEPFGRCVVEARAAGCDLMINSLVGAGDYFEHDDSRLQTAAADFWELIVG